MNRAQLFVLALLAVAVLVAVYVVLQLGPFPDWGGDAAQLLYVVLALVAGALFVERLPSK